MSKNFSKANKKKMSRLIKQARRNNFLLGDYLSLLRSISDYKANKRLERRYRTYTDWGGSEPFLSFLSVPVRLNHSKKAISYLIMSEEDIPKKYENLRDMIEKQ